MPNCLILRTDSIVQNKHPSGLDLLRFLLQWDDLTIVRDPGPPFER